jgi:hypothetical protein
MLRGNGVMIFCDCALVLFPEMADDEKGEVLTPVIERWEQGLPVIAMDGDHFKRRVLRGHVEIVEIPREGTMSQ